MANITGWGRSTWNSGTWGEPVPVELTGVAGTTALGSETATGGATISLTGLAATGAIGSETVTGVANVSVTGLAGTGEVGNLIVWGEILPDQNADWSTTSTTQSPSWEEVA